MSALVSKLAKDGGARRNTIILLGVTGLLTGIILALTLSDSNLSVLTTDIRGYAASGSLTTIGTLDLFLDAFIKYGHTPLLIWILAFSSVGLVGAGLLLAVKFTSASFTVTIFIICFGWKGFVYALFACMIQQSIMLVAYSFMFNVSIRFSDVYHSGKKAVTSKHFKQYLILCFSCEAVAIAIAIIEAVILRNIIIFIDVLS